MSILNMFGGDMDPSQIQNILTDSEKVKQFLPLLGNLVETFKQDGEHSIVALISLEDGQPILRVVATRIVDNKIVCTRQVNNSDGSPIKFNLLELIAAQNEQKQ